MNILSFLLASLSLLVLRPDCCGCGYVSGLPCFIARTQRLHNNNHNHGNHRHTQRRSVFAPDSKQIRINNSNSAMHYKPRPKINHGQGSSDRQVKNQELKTKEANLVEKLLSDAVDKMNRSISETKSNNNEKSATDTTMAIPLPSKLFPSVRQCNAALATFGDAGEYRRALTLFTQMKKSASLFGTMSTTTENTVNGGSCDARNANSNISSSTSTSSNNPLPPKHTLQSIDLVLDPPKPTLVTYSTLMSRAVSLGKPRVALRLWNLMRNQPNFHSNVVARRNVRARRAAIAANNRKLKQKKTIDNFMEEGREEVEAAVEEEATDGEDEEEDEDDSNEEVIVPDVIFCNTLMNAYAKLGDHVSARSILNAMLVLGDNDNSNANNTTIKCHEGIPPTAPTVVTYNTLADACKAAGELGAALEVPELMTNRAEVTRNNNLLPDARTYSILISTVARKKKNDKEARDVRSGGENDPDMAFALLNRMMNEGITPNGVTYCALIDVCSRCRRNDLALNGLRIMLKQKSKASLAVRRENIPMYHQQALFNEVGAWTAAINACGKTGRVDTAMKLFQTMQKFGIKPNQITCGCLSDCLLKASPMRMTETLEVLQYMKREGLVPSEVMYTSLMGVALTLAQNENKSLIRKDGLQVQIIDKFEFDRQKRSSSSSSGSNLVPGDGDAKEGTDTTSMSSEAIVLYGELMRCLINDGNDDMLLKVFLVFQEMRNAGAVPDVACYNSLLRACAFSGDVEKARDVLLRMINANDGIVEPNRNSWREVLKAAVKARRSDVADSVWDAAVKYRKKDKDFTPFVPQVSDVELLLNVYVSELGGTNDHRERSLLNEKIVNLYEDIISKSEERGLNHESFSVDEIEENQEFMLVVLRAAVSYELHGSTEAKKRYARELACNIAGLEVFQRRLSPNVNRAGKKALQLAQNWLYSY